jgi:LysR family transcriptional regulator, low CO2-responsive transcriptional regulator
MLFSSDALEAFAVFAELRNFTRAAAVLHLSQPSLHVKIRKLAGAVGVPLYWRDGRSLQLTQAGEQLAAHARGLREQQRLLLAGLGQPQADEPLTIATGEGALSHVLDSGLRLLSKRKRQRLRFTTADAATSIDLVQRGRADLGVAVVDEFPPLLSFQSLCCIGQKLIVPIDHPLARRTKGKKISLRDLHGEQLVVPSIGRPHRTMIARALRAADVQWQPSVEVSRWDTMVQMVGLGFGVAIVNDNVRLGRGVVGIALPMLPYVEYHAFWISSARRQDQIRSFVAAMLVTALSSSSR